jgi:hypothetical protein
MIANSIDVQGDAALSGTQTDGANAYSTAAKRPQLACCWCAGVQTRWVMGAGGHKPFHVRLHLPQLQSCLKRQIKPVARLCMVSVARAIHAVSAAGIACRDPWQVKIH